MSRAFVKEADGMDFVEQLPDRPVSEHPNLVTARGLKLIDDEVRSNRQALATAQSGGDRTMIARCMRELRYWTTRRGSAQLVEPPPADAPVSFGDAVRLELEDGSDRAFRIVGEDEADPSEGRISWLAPIAQAVMGREVDDAVTLPAGDAEIVEIDRTPEECD